MGEVRMKIFRLKKIWKSMAVGLCGILAAGLIAGCGGDNSSANVDKGVLKVGVTNFLIPWSQLRTSLAGWLCVMV